MNIDLLLQQDFISPELTLNEDNLQHVITTTLQHIEFEQDVEIGIACVDLAYSQELNHQYRQ